jgi:hypothetical protein
MVMLRVELKRLFAKFAQATRAKNRVGPTAPAALFYVDPFWHGDHWQNLLASPMDARHYVMEDWTPPTQEPESGIASSSRERRNRRGHR